MNIYKALFFSVFFLRVSIASANAVGDLQETFKKAIKDAPKVAKLACSEHVRSHIIWTEGPSNPVQAAKIYFAFRKQRAQYLGDLYDLDLFDLEKEESTFVRDVSDHGYRSATVDRAFYSSLQSFFTADFLEMVHLKSFYLNAVFNSEIFKETIQECVEFYGYDLANLDEDILKKANRKNRIGFVSAQVFTTLMAGGALSKLVSTLPKAGRIAFTVGALGGGAYLAYSMLTPALRQLQQIKDATEQGHAVQVVFFEDRNQWISIFNQIIDLKDKAIAFNESPSEEQALQRAKQYDEALSNLATMAPSLERILRDYLQLEDSGELSDDQKIDLQLLNFALVQLQIKRMKPNE